jgi:hypothetical protein
MLKLSRSIVVTVTSTLSQTTLTTAMGSTRMRFVGALAVTNQSKTSKLRGISCQRLISRVITGQTSLSTSPIRCFRETTEESSCIDVRSLFSHRADGAEDHLLTSHNDPKKKKPADLEDVISRAKGKGVERMMITGTSLQETREALVMAREHGTLFDTAKTLVLAFP